jgi:transcriptional regulator with XRE-family HTH domain
MTTEMTLPGLVPQWTLGDRLRKAREIASLNQSEMAEQIGIARNSIANYEGGKYEPPRPVMIAWAFRTGVALDWLETGRVTAVPDDDETHHNRSDAIPTGREQQPPTMAEIKGLRKRIPLRAPRMEPLLRLVAA